LSQGFRIAGLEPLPELDIEVRRAHHVLRLVQTV
jgi:hypothetical protein